MSKNVKIIVASACFVLALLIFCFTTLQDITNPGPGKDLKMWLKCFNDDCNTTYSLTPNEFSKLMKSGKLMGSEGYKCEDCGEKNAYRAHKCEKCDEVFVIQNSMIPQQTQDYPDRCPACDYSFMEDMQNTPR